MNYLQLCQRTRQKAGIAGEGPATTVNQTGQLGRLVNWVAEAWSDVQSERPNWLFMNEDFTFNTQSGVRDYTAADQSITDLDIWDRYSFLIYETAVGETDQNALPFKPYAEWRGEYRARMNARDDNRPTMFTLLPDNSVRFESRPDTIYTVEGAIIRHGKA